MTQYSEDVQQTFDKCMDAEGYLLFTASLTNRKDAEGRQIIEHRYKRHHFSLEDAKAAIGALENFVADEFEQIARGYQGPRTNGAPEVAE